jgi:predicted DNA binding CopG/RHH family protein
MPKAAELNIDLNEPTHHQPQAATSPRKPAEQPKQQGREVERPKNDTPVNFRWPAAEVKALKQAALDADMTLQDFLLSCFHAYMKNQGRV